ncbi:ABC transporter substrate-binding protein [Homoserinibacter sp. GY 40078]|uniref:ABC transporter substrate-binding protein n=1 Tax=Homoserinibacter sp. GY 40078 TaxID=2603275 RepID=UPI0011CB1E5E|nr:extracellular solute-binding protein [Homoserinibacter sp. GY 40078]TXK19389.1 extracellular solute-binding protein [Homoserinibacter sp. GY 40078]
MRTHRLVAATIVAALGVSLAGCSAGDTADGEPVTIQFWAWAPGMDVAVEQFNSTHPDIQVEYTDAGGGNDSSAKLITAVRAGNAPDAALIEYTALPRMIIAGVAEDMTEYVGDVQDAFTEGTWQQTTFDGKVYGVPQDVGPMAFVYRDDIFSKYGLDAPATWDDFRSAAETLKVEDPDATIASLSTDAWGWYAAVAATLGEDWWSVEDNVWTVNIDGEGSQRVLSFFNDMYNDGLIAADPILNPSYNSKLNDGTMLSWPSAAWAPGVIYGVAPDTAGNWELSPFPVWDEGDTETSYQGGSGVSLISGSEHPEQTAEFIKWLNASDEGVDLLLNESNLYPAAISGQESAISQDPPKLMPQQTDYYQVVADISKNTRAVTWGPNTDVAQSAFTDAMNAAVQNGTPWVDVLTATQKAVYEDMKKQGFEVREG